MNTLFILLEKLETLFGSVLTTNNRELRPNYVRVIKSSNRYKNKH